MAEMNVARPVDDDIKIEIPVYKKEDFSEVAEQYETGAKRINVPATATIIAAFVKMLQDMCNLLNIILGQGRMFQYTLVRKYNLQVLSFQNVEFPLFAAFAAPEDQLYYQSEDS